MYRIGDFAKLSHVSVKTLHYYDEIGLLRPAVVDHYTRYRYYTDEQVEVLRHILELKEMGFSLEKVACLVAQKDLPDQQMRRMLRLRRIEILQQIEVARLQLAQVENRLSQLKKGDSQMKEAKIIAMQPFQVVGMRYLGKNEHGEISQMWAAFNQVCMHIPHLSQDCEAAFGLCCPNAEGLIDYIAGLPVSQVADIPAGMVSKAVPAQTYVVFEAHGLQDIMPTYKTILEEWLPNSGYLPGDGPDFEYYPAAFDVENPQTSLLYIYFPIQKG